MMNDVTNEMITNRFLYHKPDSQEMLDRLAKLRELHLALAKEVLEMCPDGRERNIAFTHLEEASMWAIKSIVLGAPIAK